MARAAATACLLAACVALAAAAASTPADAPIAFAPTESTKASAPNPKASYATRSKPYALDSLATTPTSYNQIQVGSL